MRTNNLTATTTELIGGIMNNGVSKKADSIFFAKKELNANHVNLIGEITSVPTKHTSVHGREVIKFTISTKEYIIDADGETRTIRHWHRVTAWGKWYQIVETFAQIGIKVAIEGKLASRFYFVGGDRKFMSEVEVNDMVFM